ncbi:MAG TPA: intein-containing Rv2578c family radical SAM protein [Capillimicrobium sp.]
MRWDNLTVEADESTRLPGYRDGAVVRRFDAPEALDTRFYEVHAKSALNRVPEQSAVPFRWTVNPYRGCSHACVYCLGGDTPILLANGRTKPMADLRVGERIVGTERDGRYRRYAETEVRDHWQTLKPAFRVTLEDGTELVTSGDHRFLTDRGWKHVTGRGGGEGQRPYLTLNNELLGTGGFAAPPEQTPDYRQGYLCGMVRGDARDLEAVRRVRAFQAKAGAPADDLRLVSAGAAAPTLRQQGRHSFVGDATRWPLDPSDDWRKGFLAGIFDAEGSCGGQALRIASGERAALDWTAACLAHFGFHAIEELPGPNGVASIRLRGGLRERLRFFHLTDPAITRKRTVQGMALKSDARTRVTSIEPLGVTLPLYDITTGTGDFISNGVVSHNCFARPTHKYLDFDAGRDFEKEIVVKVNVPEVLRAELRRPSWGREHVAMGTNTDPYQWVEGRYRLMPGIWEALRDARNPCSVLTKSPLLLRDLELMQQVAAVTSISANLSVPTLDEKAWRASEPHTPNPRARLEAVGELNRAGIPCGILIAPLMPGINDAPEQVEKILELAAENGATGVGGIALHLRGDVRIVFMDWLRSYRPDLVERYERLYANGPYAPQAERERLMGMVRHGTVSPWPSPHRDHRGVRRRGGAPEPPPESAARRREPAPVQEALF